VAKRAFGSAGLWFLLCAQCLVGGSAIADQVNDVTQLNPIEVRSVIAPTTLDDIVAAVRDSRGPISIGGGRYSMGGQTATEGALQIDMRRFNRVLEFSRERKEITVQTGITWRDLQEYVDPYGLSVQIMQTYANFTVGGSLSVNAHGRYLGQGPIVSSVKRLRVVLPSGELISASPREHSDIFYGVIGGYGALGVIVEATLILNDDVKVERSSEVMPLKDYQSYFSRNIRGRSGIIFHNADIYANTFDTVRAVSYTRTDKPLTVSDRLTPKNRSHVHERWIISIVSEWPGGKWLRQHVVDPWLYHGRSVEWRNYEASYDVRELEPASREKSTYVLQEYFVPVQQFDAFVPKMKNVLIQNHVNVLNISIRYATADPGTLMAWARSDVFAFVIYYEQGTSIGDRTAVIGWTRELIDAAIASDGTYYLPYQVIATPRQFHAAYPNAEAFFALKHLLDPDYKFRNRLWDAYYKPS
jgi:FAD/FMN-containing dehydrogenase